MPNYDIITSQLLQVSIYCALFFDPQLTTKMCFLGLLQLKILCLSCLLANKNIAYKAAQPRGCASAHCSINALSRA